MSPDYMLETRRGPTDEGYSDKPFEASVTSSDPTEETIDLEGFTGPDAARVPHPMLSPNSWIRAVPEHGARVIVANTAASRRRAALSYYSRQASEYVKRYNNGAGVYRPLQSGEWELMTPGIAHVFGTREGKLFLRGGVIQQQLDPCKMRLRSRAPTYKRELHRNIDSELNNEERFGVVVRHKSGEEKNRWIQTDLKGSTNEQDAKGNTKTQSFAVEYFRKFGRDGTSLIDFRQGDVYDDVGKRIQHTKSGKDLRHTLKVFTKDGSDHTAIEIDEDGNTALTTPGSNVDLEATVATLRARLAKLQVQCDQSISLTARTQVEIKGNTTARIAGTTSTILGPDPSPVNPVIKGQQFVTTIMVPLLTALQVLWEGGAAPAAPGGAGPSKFSQYKPLLRAAAIAIKPLLPALMSSLSVNVKVSQ